MSDATTATPTPSPAPERLSDQAYENLAPSERLGYARQFSQGNEPAAATERTSEPPTPSEAQEAPKTEAGKFKFGALELSEQEIADLVSFKAARDTAKLSAPQSPDAYRVELPASFQVPQGTEFRLDTNDPAWVTARAWAHKNGLSQEAFSEAISIVAGRDLITQQQVQRAVNAEVQKLGTTGPARIDAIHQFYRGILGDAGARQMMGRIFNAGDVVAHEKIISRFANQGVSSFTNGGRDPAGAADRIDDATWDRMSPGEKWSYARQFSGR